jgi:hypothetical protein
VTVSSDSPGAIFIGIEPDGECEGIPASQRIVATVWDEHDEIQRARAEAWTWFVDDPNRMQLIDAAEWATVSA